MVLYATASGEILERVIVSTKNYRIEGFAEDLVNELKWEYNELLDDELVCYFSVSSV